MVGGNIHEFIETLDNCVGKRIVPEQMRISKPIYPVAAS